MEKASLGRRRLTVLLCGSSAGTCALLMAVVLLAYGSPYNPMWWWVMGAILLASAVLPLALVGAIEWVIDGYRSNPEQ